MKKILLIIPVLAMMILIGCFGGKNVKRELKPLEKLQKAKTLLDKEKYLKAQDILSLWIIENPGSPLKDKARFWLGLTHFHTKEYLIAISEFSRLIQEMPESPLIGDAQYYIAMSYFKMSPFPELDQEYTRKALREFQLFIETFPDHKNVQDATKHIQELRQKLAIKTLKNAHLYRKMGQLNGALLYFSEILENYYDLPQAEEALFWAGHIELELKKYNEAQNHLNIYLNKYPEGKYVQKAKELLERLINEKS
ncbi:MAG: outer membrane protein assembly factor BamD [Calditrichia bacterium]